MPNNIIELPQGRRSSYSSFSELLGSTWISDAPELGALQRPWRRSMSMSPPHHDAIERSVFIGGEDTTGEALLAMPAAIPLRAPSVPLHFDGGNRLFMPSRSMASQTFSHAADSHDPSFAMAMRTAVSQLFRAGYGADDIGATLQSVARFVKNSTLSETEKHWAMFYLHGPQAMDVEDDSCEALQGSISSLSTFNSSEETEPLTLGNPANRHYYICGQQGEGHGVHMREACALIWNCIERWELLHPSAEGRKETQLMREAFAARLAELGDEGRCTNGQLALLVQVLQGYYPEVQLDLSAPVTPNALVQYLGLQLYGQLGQQEEDPDKALLDAMAQQTVDQATELYRDLPQATNWLQNVSEQISEFYANQYGYTWHAAKANVVASDVDAIDPESIEISLAALGLSYLGARPE